MQTRLARRWWPHRFLPQVVLLTSSLIVLGIIAVTAYTTMALLEQEHHNTEERLGAIARNLAFGSAHALLVGDPTSVEQLLLRAADYPGVRSIVVIDPSHRILSEVRHARGKNAEAIFNYGEISPPAGQGTQFIWRYGAGERAAPGAIRLDATGLVVWHPIEEGRLGWLRIETGVDDIRTNALRLIRDSVLIALTIIALSALVLFKLLRPGLRAMAEATEFAGGLTQARGQQTTIYTGSEELEQLGHALNETSYRLQVQETALQTSTNLLHAIFNHVVEGIITWDEAGVIQSANHAASAIFGYVEKPLIGQPILAIVPAWHTSVAATQDAHTRPVETVGIRSDGMPFPLEAAVSHFTLNKGRFFIAALQDISARKAAEVELRENESRFRYMLETCPTAARIARGSGHDVIFYNSRYAELINTEPGQATGVDPAHYYAHRDDYEDILQRLGRGERIFDRLVELKIPGVGTKWTIGSYLPIQYQGQMAVLGWFHDITAQKQAEEAMRTSREHLQQLLDAMAEGAYGMDLHGNCTFVNPAFLRILGFPDAEAVLGKHVHTLIHHTHADGHAYPAHECKIYRAFQERQTIHVTDEVFWRADGTAIPVEYWSSPIVVGGEVTGAICTFSDITERKRVERMKSEFVSTVSHELRTPLTSISGSLGLIMGGALGELPSQARQMVDIAYKNSQRLTFLINDLLDMEKLAAGKMHFELRPQHLLPLVEHALETNRPAGVERDIRLVITESLPDVQVCVDGERLMQVLSNLLSNAIKYSRPNDTVEIALRAHGAGVRVSITDHGPGIPLEFRDRIFQKFSQADSSDTRQKGGTGLGLAITRELVERMGGQIGFESQEGAGARFYFDLPVWQPHGANPVIDPMTRVTTNAPRVLVVEDEPDVAALLGLMLVRTGYAVDTAGDGEAALRALRQSHYAAMTVDLMLPGISGLELIRIARQEAKTAGLPIVVVSAKMEEGRLALAGDFSGIEWLAKPIGETQLLDALGKHLRGQSPHRRRALHVEHDPAWHALLRQAAPHFDLEHVSTLQQARAKLAQGRYEVVILDLLLPDGPAWDLVPEIRASQPGTQIIVLSDANISPEEAQRVEAALRKSQTSPHVLLDALNRRLMRPQ